ncbi:hypothetical protein [Nocardioides convexus]|uniref:hypothetical protein n=1 Tax=Nocardioides convexus TaxID=2712224 RepID=UPI002418995A|nr:hypothetical protein [Nocardioides convexus]
MEPVRRLRRAHRRPGRPRGRGAAGTGRAWRTRSCSTFSATTAPRPRAAPPAPSTRPCTSTASPSHRSGSRPSSRSTPASLGGPESYAHYPAGWAVAMDTPYQWTKQVASHYGGTRNGLVVHWPAGIRARGEPAAPVAPRQRRPADPAGGRRRARPGDDRRSAAGAARRGLLRLLLRRRRGRRAAHHAVLRDVRQPRDLPRRLDGGGRAQGTLAPRLGGDAALRGRPVGGSTTPPRTGPRRATSRPPSRSGWPRCRSLFLAEARRNHVLPMDDKAGPALLRRRLRPARPAGLDRARAGRGTAA